VNDSSPLGALVTLFLSLSLFAFGGAFVILPEIHREVVNVMGWMTDAQFAQAFAIAQAAPGPNMLVVTLIGWHVAGAWGALLATLAMTGPTCVLAYFVGGLWHRFREAHWRKVVQGALVPLTIGLIIASGLIVAEGAARTWQTAAFTAIAALVIIFTRISPLWLLASGGLLGAVGII